MGGIFLVYLCARGTGPSPPPGPPFPGLPHRQGLPNSKPSLTRCRFEAEKDHDRKFQWIDVVHSNTHHPACSFTFELVWSVCSGTLVTELVSWAQRRATSNGFTLMQIPCTYRPYNSHPFRSHVWPQRPVRARPSFPHAHNTPLPLCTEALCQPPPPPLSGLQPCQGGGAATSMGHRLQYGCQ